jgi:hypothetical protein
VLGIRQPNNAASARDCQSQVQALVDVNHKPEVHITLLHALHGLVHIVNVNHLDILGSRLAARRLMASQSQSLFPRYSNLASNLAAAASD